MYSGRSWDLDNPYLSGPSFALRGVRLVLRGADEVAAIKLIDIDRVRWPFSMDRKSRTRELSPREGRSAFSSQSPPRSSIRRSESHHPRRRSRRLQSSSASQHSSLSIPRSASVPIPIRRALSSPTFRDNKNPVELERMYENSTWNMYDRIVKGRQRQHEWNVLIESLRQIELAKEEMQGQGQPPSGSTASTSLQTTSGQTASLTASALSSRSQSRSPSQICTASIGSIFGLKSKHMIGLDSESSSSTSAEMGNFHLEL